MLGLGKEKATSPLRMMALIAIFGLSACNQSAPMMQTSGGSSAQQTGAPGIARSSGFTQFPDIPIPAGAEMNVEKTLVFGSKPWFGRLTLNADASVGGMFDFFRSNLVNHRWQEITSVRAKTSILTYSQEERVLTIAIQGSTLGGSEIMITVSPKGVPQTFPKAGAAQGDLMPVPVTKAP